MTIDYLEQIVEDLGHLLDKEITSVTASNHVITLLLYDCSYVDIGITPDGRFQTQIRYNSEKD